MQQIKLLLVLDGADRHYTAGSPVTGTVEVKVLEACQCRALRISLVWKTHGQGPSQEGTLGSLQLFEGAWQSDRYLRYPFQLEAPTGAPTYQGPSLSVDWYLRVEAELPRAVGSRQHMLEEPLTVLPAVEEPHETAGSWRRLVELPAPPQYLAGALGGLHIGIHCLLFASDLAPALVVGSLFGAPALVAMAWALTRSKSAGKRLPERGPDAIELWMGAREVVAGGALPLRVRIQAGSAFRVRQLSVTVQGEEVVGDERLFHGPTRHRWFSQDALACANRRLKERELLELGQVEVRLPEDAPASFTLGASAVRWSVKVQLHLEGAEIGGNGTLEETREVPFRVLPPARRTLPAPSEA